LLVDADTGWGQALGIARTTRELMRAGAAGMHLEDQVTSKRCGHRSGKVLVNAKEMVDRIKAAVDARDNGDLVVMARTDAFALEGLDGAVDRACQYVSGGADMIFAEALSDLDQYRHFVDAVGVPVLANLTEFGQTPLFTLDQLREAGVRLALYPLSAFRAMSAAALRVFETIRCEGTQQDVLSIMQTRQDLYRVLDYHAYEQKIDQLLGGQNRER
jgi:methylisocitrate lyase